MFRKLTRTGPASTTVALPADWIKEHQLAPGSEVRLERVADGLRITPVAVSAKAGIVIQYDPVFIVDMLTKLYTENYNLITIENPPKPIGSLISLIGQYPGFTVIESSSEQVNIQRTLTSTGENPRAILLRALRLILDGLATNPPSFSREAHDLLFLLTLEQYEPQIVTRLQEFIRTLPSTAPYYDNAYAHLTQLLADVTAQHFGFEKERAQRIAQEVHDVDEIVERGFSRTKNPFLLSSLHHSALLLAQVHQMILREQGTEALQHAKERAKKKRYTVGVCLVDKSNPFWAVDVTQGIVKEAETTDIQTVIDAPLVDSDVAAQAKILERFLHQVVDALIIVPIDSQANKDVLEKYVKAKIPIIAVDTDIDIRGVPHYFVGFDNYAGGKLVAQHMNKLVKKSAHVVLIEGRINGNSVHRLGGFVDSLNKDCTVHRLRADYVTSIAYEQLLQYAKEHKVDAVFAASDNMAQGAIQALDQLGLHVPLAGFDCTQDGIRAMQDGKQVCDVNTHPQKLGSLAVQLCQALLNNKQVAERTIYDIELVTPKQI